MPELPEMENYKKLLGERLTGKTVTKVDVTREKTINVPVQQFKEAVEGRKVVSITRKAKHLVFTLDSGNHLLLHLMLGGLMYVGSENDQLDRTKQVIISFGSVKLCFIGLRLGYLHLLTSDQLTERLSDLGPEPLDPAFSLEAFMKLIDKKRGILKTTLVKQKFLSGIGNLYSDEICFAAQLLPSKQMNELNEEQKRSLYTNIQAVLKRGISLGGYMDVPVFYGDTLTGSYNEHCYVYDREGEPCPRCNQKIIKEKISSRKVFYCLNCQH